jgi:hypothetical protein
MAATLVSSYLPPQGRGAKVASRSLGWLELVALTLILRREATEATWHGERARTWLGELVPAKVAPRSTMASRPRAE